MNGQHRAPKWQICAMAWFGAWALELLTADKAFNIALVYSTLRELPLSGQGWGVLFASYTAVAIWSLYSRSEPLKLVVGIAGAALTLFFGAQLSLGYWRETQDFLAPGVFSMVIGIGLVLGLKQWGRGNGS